jgi:hypothetical protein
MHIRLSLKIKVQVNKLLSYLIYHSLIKIKFQVPGGPGKGF